MASIQKRIYLRKSNDAKTRLLSWKPAGLLLFRHCDSTPFHLNYGHLQQRIQRFGRYFVPLTWLDRDGFEFQEWKTVSFDDYRSAYPRHSTHSVRRVGGHGAAINLSWLFAHRKDKYEEQVFPLLHSPVVIVRSNASTVFEVVNSAGPSWNVQTMKEDCPHPYSPCPSPGNHAHAHAHVQGVMFTTTITTTTTIPYFYFSQGKKSASSHSREEGSSHEEGTTRMQSQKRCLRE